MDSVGTATNLKRPLLAGERAMPLAPPLGAAADFRRPACELLLSLGAMVGTVLLVLWQYSSVLATPVAAVQPLNPANDPARSVYLGMGCFWHTQYDTFLVEQKPPFSRVADKTITSLVGYAGGSYMSADGSVCYQGNPSSDYNLLGHTEVVSVELEPLVGNTSTQAAAQFESLIRHYFDEGFFRLADGKLQRLDPMDSGPEYRNAVGLPGGSDSMLYPALVHAAADVGMPLKTGLGGPHHDKQDEFVVWVYDSIQFPFFKGEEYHQFHPNTVLGRWVPESYTGRLKATQKAQGRLDVQGCPGEGAGTLLGLLPIAIAVAGLCALARAAAAIGQLCNSVGGSTVSRARSATVQC